MYTSHNICHIRTLNFEQARRWGEEKEREREKKRGKKVGRLGIRAREGKGRLGVVVDTYQWTHPPPPEEWPGKKAGSHRQALGNVMAIAFAGCEVGPSCPYN